MGNILERNDRSILWLCQMLQFWPSDAKSQLIGKDPDAGKA